MATGRRHPNALLRPRRLLAVVLATGLVAMFGSAAMVSGARTAARASARPIILADYGGLWKMQSDGTQLRRFADCNPGSSPISSNGRRLLMTYRTGELLLLPLSGDLVRLGDCEDGRGTAIMRRYRVVVKGVSKAWLAWVGWALSPDGRRIAALEQFMVNPSTEETSVRPVVFAASGSGYRRVRPKGLDASIAPGQFTSVTWSPASDELLVTRRNQLIAMAPDGSNARVVYSDPGENPDTGRHVDLDDPDWSRAGIVFVARDSERLNGRGAARLAYVAANGSGFRGLTAWRHLSSVGYPAWSPDGRTIAHLREATSNPGVYLMNADGSNPRRITLRPVRDKNCTNACYSGLIPDTLDW